MNKKTSVGLIIAGLVQLMLIVLKCLGIITCPWLTILTPLLTGVVVAILTIFFLFVLSWICKE
jgi:hypothetical protein